MRIILPCYYTYGKRKPKTALISWNWYSNLNAFTKRDFKRIYADTIKEKLPMKITRFSGQYSLTYIYNYKNKSSDLSNVCGLVSKVFNDVLQELDIVKDDNVKYLVEEIYRVGSKTKEPNIEIILKKG